MQTLYDATFGRAGGGNVQAVTKGGSNLFHGAVNWKAVFDHPKV